MKINLKLIKFKTIKLRKKVKNDSRGRKNWKIKFFKKQNGELLR
jgi:hypothetical protein